MDVNKCVYCGKVIKDGEFKIKSLFYENGYVCEECVWREDNMWLKEANKNRFPDFTDELKKENLIEIMEDNDIDEY